MMTNANQSSSLAARIILLAVVSIPATSAHAHVGVGEVSGFLHPFSGLDHVLAMLALGLWAGQGGGRALWVLPATFVAMIAVGGYLGAMRIPMPGAELGIVFSVLALGLLLAGAVRPPLAASAAITALFAVCHGLAHGAEMPADASGLAYGAGFMLASALLHGAGVGIALLVQHAGRRGFVRLVGAAIAAAGALNWMVV